MLCDFYPLSNVPDNTNGEYLAISVPEIILIFWVINLATDEIREVIIFTAANSLDIFK